MVKRIPIVIVASVLILLLFSSCIAINDAKTKLAESSAVFDVEYNGRVIRDLRYGEAPRNL